MRFNYGLEKKKFDENWKIILKECKEAGMDDESIEKLYEYDWDMFKKERVWCKHNQYLDRRYLCLDNVIRESTDDFNPLMQQILEQLSCEFSEEDLEDADAWMETLENIRLYDAISSLNSEQRHILKLRIIEELTLQEIADLYGITIASVHDRIKVIFKKIKKYMD